MAITVTPQSINPNDPNPKQPGFKLTGTGDANEYSTAQAAMLARSDGTTLALVSPTFPLDVRLGDGTTQTQVIAAIGSLKTDTSSMAGTATAVNVGAASAGTQRVAALLHDGTTVASVLASATSGNNAQLIAPGGLALTGSQTSSGAGTGGVLIGPQDTLNYNWITVQMTAHQTGTGYTAVVQGNNDNGSTWNTVPLSLGGSLFTPAALSVASVGSWSGPLPYRYVRVNIGGTSLTGTTSGLIVLRAQGAAPLTGLSGTMKIADTGGTNNLAVNSDGSVVSRISDGTTTAGVVVATTALKVDIASVNGTATTAALALNSSVTGLQVTQGSTTSGQSGPLVQGAVTTGNPNYVTAQTDPLSLTTSGSLRTDITTINGGTAITLGMGAVTNAMRVAAVIGDGVNVPSVNAGTTKTLYTTINDGTTTAAVATGGGLKVAPITQTSGGLSIQSNTALTNSAIAIKASAGQIYAWDFFNPAAATTYIQIFNVAAASVTLGTTPPTHVVGVAAGGKATFAGSLGIAFGTAISYAATTTATGSTAPATAAVCAVFYA